MAKNLHPMPARDPVSGGELYVSELASDDSGVSIRGRFAISRFARLDADQTHFLETFLRCRGTINAVEKELGISYPTVKARLDQLLQALGLNPVADDKPKMNAEAKRAIIEQLEKGEITAEEAKARMRGEG
jgi:hypothetical protein